MKSLHVMFFALAALLSLPLQAATFTLSGGQALTLPGNFNAPAGLPTLSPGDAFTAFSAAAAGNGEGVYLTHDSRVTFEYLGTEAGNHNVSSTSQFNDFFSNKVTPVGSSYSEQQSAGALDFIFATNGAASGGIPGAYKNATGTLGLGGLWLGVFLESQTSAILMFGDGYGDTDFDDMIVRATVAPVPLPAAVWMFVAALAGFAGIRSKARS